MPIGKMPTGHWSGKILPRASMSRPKRIKPAVVPKRGPGRPSLGNTKVLIIKVSSAMHSALLLTAKAAGLSMSELVRRELAKTFGEAK